MSWDKEYERYVVKPLPYSGDHVPIRKELNDLSNEERFLYLEGMRRFQAVNMDDPLSYYQIAGIHGLPYYTWPKIDGFDNGIKEAKRDPDEDFGGFCTHSSVLFLSWHRPYLTLFESALYRHVNDVARDIDADSATKAKYTELAKNFRIPYWDWARLKVEHFPDMAFHETAWQAYEGFFKPPALKGETLNANQIASKSNPVFSFTFPAPTPDREELEPFKNIEVYKVDENGRRTKTKETQSVKATIRYPVYGGAATPNSVTEAFRKFFTESPLAYKRRPGTNGKDDPGERYDINDIPIGMRPKERNLSERVAYLLKAYRRYGPMAYNAQPEFVGKRPADAPKVELAEVWGSLEDIHNAVHNLAGGGGHMSSVPTSAFDPIFWLHHANIDRLAAIWQALHETDQLDTYIEERPVPDPSFAKAEGFREDMNTPLWPFRKALAGDAPWWTSADAKRTEPFGYAYAETLGWVYPGEESARATLVAKINEKYSSLSPMIEQSRKGIATAGAEILPQAAFLKKLAATKDEMHISTQANDALSQMTFVQQIDEALPKAQELVEQYSGKHQPYLKNLLDDENSYLEWLVNVKARKHTLGGQAVVHFFLGEVPPAEIAEFWPYTPYHVGTFVPLGQNEHTSCAKCRQGQANDLEVTGQVPLTIALAERYLNKTIANLTEDEVVEYLRDNLHWRTVLTDGTIVENQTDVDGLLVFVVSNKVTLSPDGDKPPVYADKVTIHARATSRTVSSPAAGGASSAPEIGGGGGTGLTEGQFDPYKAWFDSIDVYGEAS